ncbi:response regulator [Candidatus Sumerlaeota bacterium]|nr:response regulator [Candidatus Sumerlaeota bacterium]
MTESIRVLIVDDNQQYREAFSRNLAIQGMSVLQAEHGDQAMEVLKGQSPDVMVTDLQMRTDREGLTLIRDARAVMPCMPIIMISAVGTFDEGAIASQLGAAYVLSKARIEEEIDTLYDCIRGAYATYVTSRAALKEIESFLPASEDAAIDTEHAIVRLREILADPNLDSYVKGEAFDALSVLSEAQLRQTTRADLDRALAAPAAEGANLEKVNAEIAEMIPQISQLDPETLDAFRTAEFLFQNSEGIGMVDLSRSTCFSFCFSVENQAKLNLRRRLAKFLGERKNYDLIRSLLEKPSNHVNMFFHQHILQTMRDRAMDFTIDNVRQTFLRILEHTSKYRPDGLKALGIVLLAFGRTYEFKQANKTVRIQNPLGIKGFDEGDEVVRLAELLVNLQHFRNPYIHPEIKDKQALAKIRDTAVECLNLVMRMA